jgi:SAM-dependent methyltransferase
VYEDVIANLRAAYDRGAEARDRATKTAWKEEERQRFLDTLRAEGKQTLLEVGAGTGQDGLFFQQGGLDVTCADLSPAMVARCHEKGLRAYVRDFLHLDFPPASFDAVYAINCLLHVPKADLPAVLAALRTVLRPDGLFYLGLYGGEDSEGVWPGDDHEPKRFFSFHTDDGIQRAVRPHFTILHFDRVPLDGEDGRLHFQSLLLRR